MKYILFYSEGHKSYGLYKDLEYLNNVEVILRPEKKIRNKLLKIIKHVHCSGSISKYINFPLKHIWYEKKELNLPSDEEYCILFDDLTLKSFSQSELNAFTSKDNVKCILLLLNSMDSEVIKRSAIKEKIRNTNWNDVYTFDPQDVEKYHFKFIDFCYYSKHNIEVENEYEYNIYFVGALYQNRKKIILEIFDWLNQNGVTSEFYLQTYAMDNRASLPFSDKIHYFSGAEGRLNYDEIIAGDLRAGTILEVVQKNQSGPTLRYFEAVVYNRKLLTNNQEIINFPFYNDEYMKIFDKPEDINIEWLKTKNLPDYHYNNEFSPVHLIEKVKETC